MSDDARVPDEYVAEQIREAVAREAHDLGITVSMTDSEVLLKGVVETDAQRVHVEEIARRFVTAPVRNEIEIVDLEGAVKQESLT